MESGQRARFDASCRAETLQLLDQSVFDVTHAFNAEYNRIYGARVNEIVEKICKPEIYEKSRLVIQGFENKSHRLMTCSPTVLRISQKISICIVALTLAFCLFLCNTTKAWLQAKAKATRKFYICSSPDLKLLLDFYSKFIVACMIYLKRRCTGLRPIISFAPDNVKWFCPYTIFACGATQLQLYIQQTIEARSGK